MIRYILIIGLSTLLTLNMISLEEYKVLVKSLQYSTEMMKQGM